MAERLAYDNVKQSFEKEGYTLLSKEYVNKSSYLDFICPLGHINNIMWNNWQQGHRCSVCSKKKKHTIKEIKIEFEKEGYILLSTEYINAHQYLNFICPSGHKHRIKWNDWRKGTRCRFCSKFSNIIEYEQIKKSFNQEEYTLLSKKYKNSKSYLKYICPKGHKHKITWWSWKEGHRCPCCVMKGFSKPEKEIVEYVKNNYNGVIKENDRTLIKNPKTSYPLELDIWLPVLRKAIEYNSRYYHRSEYSMWKDQYKKQWCKENNIDLLVIQDEEWRKNKNFNIINNFIGVL